METQTEHKMWINKLFEELLNSLDDILDIADICMVLKTITDFEQMHLTKSQIKDTKIVERIRELYENTPNQYLKSRLELLLAKWIDICQNESVQLRKPKHAVINSVFEAVIKNDDLFFETRNVPDLLHRLLKSFDKNYKVVDMATVLNTITTLEEMDIPVSQLATTHLVTYVSKLRRHTTNKYLSKRLREILIKWRALLMPRNKNRPAKTKPHFELNKRREIVC